MIFLVWDADGGETEADAVRVEADFADEAAAQDAERRSRIAAEPWATADLRVKGPEEQVHDVKVYCEYEPTYYTGKPVPVAGLLPDLTGGKVGT